MIIGSVRHPPRGGAESVWSIDLDKEVVSRYLGSGFWTAGLVQKQSCPAAGPESQCQRTFRRIPVEKLPFMYVGGIIKDPSVTRLSAGAGNLASGVNS
jgi:hypothetical protein